MKTCENCVGYDFCPEFYQYREEEIKKLTEGDIRDVCPSFKDKSKLIELPCYIGDNVYMIVTENVDVDGYRMQWEKETFVKKIPFNLNMFDQFGKSVFLTREDAEKRLQEINSNTKN